MAKKKKHLVFCTIKMPASWLGWYEPAPTAERAALRREGWLDVREKAVLVTLLEMINWERADRTCWPSLSTIAATVGMSERSAWRCVAVLDEVGLLKIRSDVGRSAVYHLEVDVIRDLYDHWIECGRSMKPPPDHRKSGEGTKADHRKSGEGTLANIAGDRRKSGERTSKEQPTQNMYPSFRCSTRLKVEQDDHQRKLPFPGVVRQVANKLRSPAAKEHRNDDAQHAERRKRGNDD